MVLYFLLHPLKGYKSGISRLLVDQGLQIISSQTSSAGCFALANSPALTAQTSYVASADRVDRSEQTISSDLEDEDSLGGLGASLTKSAYPSAPHDAYKFSGDPAGRIYSMFILVFIFFFSA